MYAVQLIFLIFGNQILLGNLLEIHADERANTLAENIITETEKSNSFPRNISSANAYLPIDAVGEDHYPTVNSYRNKLVNFYSRQYEIPYTASRRLNRVTRDVDILFSICSVKEQDLNDLLDVISGAQLSPEATDRINQNKSSGERCKQLLQNIKEATQKLRKDFQQIQTTSYKEIKAQYDDEIKKLQTMAAQYEDSNRKTKARLDVVLTKYQLLQHNLNDALKLPAIIRRELTEKILRLCSALIASDQIDLAVEEFIKLNDTKEINKIIRDAYNGDIRNFHRVIKFIELQQNDNNLNQWSAAYTTLSNEMKKNNHFKQSELFILAYKVKAILDRNIDISSKSTFERLRYGFPAAVRAIVWGQVCLKSKTYNEYLYPGADDLAADNDRRRLFTWVPKIDKFREGYWAFEPSTVDGRYLRMRNVHFNEYFFAAVALHDDNRREVYTWRPKAADNGCTNEQCMWEVTVSDENSVKLRNVEFKEFLYTGDDFHDKERRSVYTWKPGSCGEQCIWEIIPC